MRRPSLMAVILALASCMSAGGPHPLPAQTVDTLGWTRDSTSRVDTTGWAKDSTPIVTWRFDSNAVTALTWLVDSTPITQPHPVPPPPPPVASGHPNEPKGYRVSRTLTGAMVPRGMPAPASPEYSGNCYGSAVGNVTVVGGALQTRFPADLTAGVGPVNFGCYDIQNRELSALYFSAWVQIAGPDYENQASGTKLGFFANGRNMMGENETFFFLTNPAAKQGVQSAWAMEVRQQGIPQANGSVTRNLTPNVDRRPLMTAGTWHHWELALSLNTIGQADGTARFWIDGVLVFSYSNVIFRTAAYPKGFTLWKWNPTWGGSGGTRTRADFVQLRDIYLSGTP